MSVGRPASRKRPALGRLFSQEAMTRHVAVGSKTRRRLASAARRLGAQ